MRGTHDHERVQAERDFHNARFTEETRAGLSKYYDVIANGSAVVDQLIAEHSRDAVVLEYGCATGARSIELAHRCKEIHGIDISDVAINKARLRAADVRAPGVQFHVMNGEAMSFDDATFDMIFGRGILHHLNIDMAFSELARVLKPSGIAVFYEPLGHNPVINWYRRRTPHLRTPDEHPLLMRDFTVAKKYFARLDYKMYGLASLAAVPLRNTPVGVPIRSMLQLLDRMLLTVPPIRKYAWFTLIQLRKR